jgi:serine/threonine protein kinase
VSNPPRDDRTRFAPSSPQSHPAEALAPGEFRPGEFRAGDFNVGEVIGGNYRVLTLIGRGGMGTVYRVYHLFLDKEMALKTLSGDQITKMAWKRFQIEGLAIARLNHPNIIRIYDLGIAGHNRPYYVMDVVEGISLAQIIADQGALKPAFALPIFRQVSAGLAYAHDRGIIHRDLKPANIMLVSGANTGPKAGPKAALQPGPGAGSEQIAKAPASSPSTQSVTTTTAKILDFGLAKLTDLAGGGASGLTKTGEIFGSPLYMSPEQAQGLSIDQTTDIYSFGCTLFEALTGQPPIKGANAIETLLMHQSKTPPRLSQARPDLEFSPDLERMVAKLLAKKPEDRYPSFADIASQLLLMERSQDMGIRDVYQISTAKPSQSDRQMTGEFTNPPPPSLTTRPWFWTTFLAGGALFLTLLGLGSYLLFAPKPDPSLSASNSIVLGTTNQNQPGSTSQKPEQRGKNSPAQNIAEDGPKEASVGSTTMDKIGLYNKDPHFSSIAGSGSGQLRVFNFPEEQNLGSITFEMGERERKQLSRDWQLSHGTTARDPYYQGVRAQGRQVFPFAAKLGFTPNRQICQTPSIFKNFRSDDLFQLDLSNNDFVNSDFLPYIKHLKGLSLLALNDDEVNDRAIKVLDDLPNLEFISIDDTQISGDALAQSTLIKHISSLSYTAGKDVAKVLKTMKHAQNIIELNLSFNNLTTDDLNTLAGMPKLCKLTINGCHIGDQGLRILAHSKVLTSLNIEDLTLTPASIETFATWNLQKLVISGAGWSNADRGNLHGAMARQHCYLNIKAEDN